MNLNLDKLAHLPTPDSPSTQWQRAEGLEIERVRAIDCLVGDLCEHLACARGDVFALAQAHAAGDGDGRAALCHQALALLAERERFHVLCDTFLQMRIGGLLDYGHGCAALTLPFAHLVGALMVVDDAGPALEFCSWRASRHGLAQTMALRLSDAGALPAGAFPMVVCCAEQPEPEAVLAQLDRWLAPRGLLMLAECWSPWRQALLDGGYGSLHEGPTVSLYAKPG